MATLVITIVSAMTVADITDQLQGVGTISNNSASIDRVARYVDGIANGAFAQTSVTTAVS